MVRRITSTSIFRLRGVRAFAERYVGSVSGYRRRIPGASSGVAEKITHAWERSFEEWGTPTMSHGNSGPGCEPVLHQPRSRLPNWPARRSTLVRGVGRYQPAVCRGQCTLFTRRDERAQTDICTRSRTANLFPCRGCSDVLGCYLCWIRSVVHLLLSPREACLDLDPKDQLQLSCSNNLDFLPSRHPSSFQMLPPDCGTGRLQSSATLWIRLRGMGSVLKGRLALS